jgi:hypothetical protein
MDPIALKSVRPLIFKTIQMTDLRRVNFSEKNGKKLSQQIETELRYEVEEMIRRVPPSCVTKCRHLNILSDRP